MGDLPWDAKEITIGQLSERSGVPLSALRFYEAKGLISSRRTVGNQRRYARDTLRRVTFIRYAQRVGISLGMIRDALAELPDGRTPTRGDWARLSRSWRDELETRILHMQRLKDNLTECIGCGCLSISRCRLGNTRDELGQRGPGPHRLYDGDFPS
ncbi:redox-sensitive transcriptional activator SoxR [Saccharothrix variisporea]|uniref:MerR family redox-sensitive transcriptional activator SoxR n=1 Tax=Saccharothrix variisporea TaxID=543527 RepID=A0A495XJK3_9PSEU|nr:redox-sensitive transcriptional activator SoxR [Saccharothrix variisporea]RKT74701.1 MerR family redox-sensitive transcriptional activator SoxR [Saccharothrix variisporea]